MGPLQTKSHLLTNTLAMDRCKSRGVLPWFAAIWMTVLLPWSSVLAVQSRPSATIHWQHVPLRDALHRLEDLFNQTVFLDRRVNPNLRVSLDIEASNLDQAIDSITHSLDLTFVRLGPLVYIGPPQLTARLSDVAARRSAEVTPLPRSQKDTLQRKRRVTWLRLTEPRQLLKSIVESHGWRMEGAERIPHDLWPAGSLPPLSVVEQLTILLFGFDLTFELSPNQRVISVVPLPEPDTESHFAALREPPHTAPATHNRSKHTRQLYTLRVKEQPVATVLGELSRRLKWEFQVDHQAIQAAGRSLQERVSFAVEDVEQEDLLKALLYPAGLDFRRAGERITIVPRDERY